MIPVRENSDVVIIYPEQSFNTSIKETWSHLKAPSVEPNRSVLSAAFDMFWPRTSSDVQRYPIRWSKIWGFPMISIGGTPIAGGFFWGKSYDDFWWYPYDSGTPHVFANPLLNNGFWASFSLHLWNCIPSLPNSSSLYLCLLCNTWAKYGWIYQQKIPLGLKPHNFPMINHQTSKNGHLFTSGVATPPNPDPGPTNLPEGRPQIVQSPNAPGAATGRWVPWEDSRPQTVWGPS